MRWCGYNNPNESTITISNRNHLGNLRLKKFKKHFRHNFCLNKLKSICNKFGHLCELVANKADIISNNETKLYSSFPILKFLIPASKLFKMDVDRTNMGIFSLLKVFTVIKIFN